MKAIGSLNKEKVSGIISGVAFLVDEAIFLFEQAHGRSDWQGRTGGYFCLANAETGLPLLVLPLGQVPLEKAEKYLRLCQEKAKRLAEHLEHLSSWESRNPDKEQWGGAVRVGNLIFSFSGLPEMGDEAVMLAVAGSHYVGTKDVSETLSTIASRSQNELWDQLQKFLSRHV